MKRANAVAISAERDAAGVQAQAAACFVQETPTQLEYAFSRCAFQAPSTALTHPAPPPPARQG